MTPLDYALITPARDEAANLRRLAAALAAQTTPPTRWVIVDNGSKDDTAEVGAELARELDWVVLHDLPTTGTVRRGGPVVRAFHAGLATLGSLPAVVVKLDADVTMDPDYFERLLAAFAQQPDLGMASGSEWVPREGGWVQQFGTRSSVWGPARAYRRECLDAVLPLEERMGWDGIDEFKANLAGWKTQTLLDLPYRHHRLEGLRDGARWRPWAAQGEVGHFMDYRLSYLLLRSLHRARREPAALAILYGYAACVLRRERRHPDPAVRAHLRRQQRWRELPRRRREALGRTLSI